MYRSVLPFALAALVIAALASAATSAARRTQPATAHAATVHETDAALGARLADVAAIPVPPAPAPRPAQPSYEVLTVRPGKTVALRSRPGGPVVARDGATTEFGSPQALTVVARRGPWIGVTSDTVGNGQLAWIRRSTRSVSVAHTQVSLHVSLSRRLLELRLGSRVVRRVEVGVGQSASPTPEGRFAVTDKLSGAPYGGVYGCCILALSGYQTHTPPGWAGGDRIAIHGTDAPGTIGGADSAGCIHAADDDLRALMGAVPLGTPVFISA